MDMWELSIDDPLRIHFYHLTTLPFDSNRKLRYLGRLWVAGQLYKSIIDGSSMASENHRHFALRKPKSLRSQRNFIIPIGPFFDSWGETLSQSLSPESPELSEILEALIQGWMRLPKTVGYGRAIRSISEAHPHLLSKEIKELKKDRLKRQILETPCDRFELKWNKAALELMDDIPSRA